MDLMDNFEDLSDPAHRNRLASRTSPYWQVVNEGCLLGYVKTDSVRVWLTRCTITKRDIREQRLGFADDLEAADGKSVLDFAQAEFAARNWHRRQLLEDASKPIDDSPFNKYGPACGRD